MIKVDKDLEDIPASLLDRKTITRRNTCIRDKKYHQEKVFNQRYKQKDIKDKLNIIYNKKCAFCESIVYKCEDDKLEDNSSTIEHYRPKSKYYWLAYSWDNLLLCCHRCNQNKDNNFKIENELNLFNKDTFSKKIHKTIKIYNRIEKPFMINPEIENVIDKLIFNKFGKIDSEDNRVKYTIDTCKLDRDELNEKRKVVIDEFKNKINAYTLENKPTKSIFKELLQDIRDKNREFIALRFWILKNFKSVL